MARFQVDIFGDTDEVEHLDVIETDSTDIDDIVREVSDRWAENWQSIMIRFDRG